MNQLYLHPPIGTRPDVLSLVYFSSSLPQITLHGYDCTLGVCMKLERSWTTTMKLNTSRRLLIIVIIMNLNFVSSALIVNVYVARDNTSMFGHADLTTMKTDPKF